jgi:hypothetical protein
MGVVQASSDDGWVIKDLMRKKFIQALDGKTIPNPGAFVKSAEGQELLKTIQAEVEAFVGYTLEESTVSSLNDDLASEIKYSSRTLGDESMKDGAAELACDSPEDIM